MDPSSFVWRPGLLPSIGTTLGDHGRILAPLHFALFDHFPHINFRRLGDRTQKITPLYVLPDSIQFKWRSDEGQNLLRDKSKSFPKGITTLPEASLWRLLATPPYYHNLPEGK